MSRFSPKRQTERDCPRATSTQPKPTANKVAAVDSPSRPVVAAQPTQPSLFEEDLDNNPHSHFLSPVHMYESWDDSDDDSDDGSFEFDAGITDFALFNDDFKRAKEQNVPLSNKWSDFVEDQAQCLDRAVARSRAELVDRPSGPFYSGSSLSQPRDAVPSLTPDTSPRLADDLDYDSAESSSDRSYRTKIVTPASTQPASSPINIPGRSQSNLSTLTESAIDDNEFEDTSAPAFLLYRHSQRAGKGRQLAKPQPPPMRPGLSAGSRTLSGKLHVWRRPSCDLFSVEEEADEEAKQAGGKGKEVDGILRKKRAMSELRA